MSHRCAWLIAVMLVVFGSLVLSWQIQHFDMGTLDPYPEPYSSVGVSSFRACRLATITNIAARDGEYYGASGGARLCDIELPATARVFLADMTGKTNAYKLPIFYYLNYHLFPRDVETTLDSRPQLTQDGFFGRGSSSDDEMRAQGFDVRVDITPDYNFTAKLLSDLKLNYPTNPSWFDSRSDQVIGWLLPLATAFAGMWVFRALFSGLVGRISLAEQLACSLALGMMALAAVELGCRLCGCRVHWVVFAVVVVAAAAELWCNRHLLVPRGLVCNPIYLLLTACGLGVFVILFRLAGLEGFADPDSAMAWLLKTKILYLFTAHDIIRHFSNPNLALANLDYPILVPSLLALSYDSIGHVNEYVAKFWSLWALLFLLLSLAGPGRSSIHWRNVFAFVVLGLLLLPAIQRYGQTEVGTMLTIFFTMLGFAQCTYWLLEKDTGRLALGLTLLFGAGMVKCEGFVFLSCAVAWIVIVPSARPQLRIVRQYWVAGLFCFCAALPFLWLRSHIPAAYQSAWDKMAMHHPASLLVNWPGFFVIQLSSLFVNHDLSAWTGAGGSLHWAGQFKNLDSLYNHRTLGLAWVCLGLSIICWLAAPGARRVIVWMVAMLLGAVAGLSVVFASYVSGNDLQWVINLYGGEMAAGRYLWPILFAWVGSLLVVLMAGTSPGKNEEDPAVSPFGPAAVLKLPLLDRPVWLAGIVLAIVLIVGFVLPLLGLENNGVTPPQPVTINLFSIPDSAGTANQEVSDGTADADALEAAGRYGEEAQLYRKLIQSCPTNPVLLNNFAWFLATAPQAELRNGKQAVEYATRALSLSDGRTAPYFCTLGAAYAEAGQFDEATKYGRRARNVAILSGQLDSARESDHILELYAAHKTLVNGPTNAQN